MALTVSNQCLRVLEINLSEHHKLKLCIDNMFLAGSRTAKGY